MRSNVRKIKNGIHDSKHGRCIPWVVVLALLFLSSCVTTGTTPEGSGDAHQKQKAQFFQSKDYILYELQGGETPETLAVDFLGDPEKSWLIEDHNQNVTYKKGQLIVIPLKEQARGGLTINGYQKVPILVYHTFGINCRSSLCMPAKAFDEQMAYLKSHGYRVISLRELVGFLQLEKAIPKKAVVITIDDGYRSVYDIAFPILQKYGFTATLFIYTDFVNIPKSSVTWAQLQEMKSNGFEVGSHTLSHCNLTKKLENENEEVYLKRVEKELVLSKKMLDEKLNQNTIALGFPYGAYNRTILAISEKAGYKLALSVKKGGNPFFADPLTPPADPDTGQRSGLFCQEIRYVSKTFPKVIKCWKKLFTSSA